MSLDIIKERTSRNIFGKDLWGLGMGGNGLYNRLFSFDDYYMMEDIKKRDEWLKAIDVDINELPLDDINRAWDNKKETDINVGPFFVTGKEGIVNQREVRSIKHSAFELANVRLADAYGIKEKKKEKKVDDKDDDDDSGSGSGTDDEDSNSGSGSGSGTDDGLGLGSGTDDEDSSSNAGGSGGGSGAGTGSSGNVKIKKEDEKSGSGSSSSSGGSSSSSGGSSSSSGGSSSSSGSILGLIKSGGTGFTGSVVSVVNVAQAMIPSGGGMFSGIFKNDYGSLDLYGTSSFFPFGNNKVINSREDISVTNIFKMTDTTDTTSKPITDTTDTTTETTETKTDVEKEKQDTETTNTGNNDDTGQPDSSSEELLDLGLRSDTGSLSGVDSDDMDINTRLKNQDESVKKVEDELKAKDGNTAEEQMNQQDETTENALTGNDDTKQDSSEEDDDEDITGEQNNTKTLNEMKEQLEEELKQNPPKDWKKYTSNFLAVFVAMTSAYLKISKNSVVRVVLNETLGKEGKIKLDKAVDVANKAGHFLLNPGENGMEIIQHLGNKSEEIWEFAVGSNYVRDIKNNSFQSMLENKDEDLQEMKDIKDTLAKEGLSAKAMSKIYFFTKNNQIFRVVVDYGSEMYAISAPFLPYAVQSSAKFFRNRRTETNDTNDDDGFLGGPDDDDDDDDGDDDDFGGGRVQGGNKEEPKLDFINLDDLNDSLLEHPHDVVDPVINLLNQTDPVNETEPVNNNQLNQTEPVNNNRHIRGYPRHPRKPEPRRIGLDKLLNFDERDRWAEEHEFEVFDRALLDYIPPNPKNRTKEQHRAHLNDTLKNVRKHKRGKLDVISQERIEKELKDFESDGQESVVSQLSPHELFEELVDNTKSKSNKTKNSNDTMLEAPKKDKDKDKDDEEPIHDTLDDLEEQFQKLSIQMKEATTKEAKDMLMIRRNNVVVEIENEWNNIANEDDEVTDEDVVTDDDQDVINDMENETSEQTRRDDISPTQQKLVDEFNDLKTEYHNTTDITERKILTERMNVAIAEMEAHHAMEAAANRAREDPAGPRPETEEQSVDIQTVLDDAESNFFSKEPINTHLSHTLNAIDEMTITDLNQVIDMSSNMNQQDTNVEIPQRTNKYVNATMLLNSFVGKVSEMDEVTGILDTEDYADETGSTEQQVANKWPEDIQREYDDLNLEYNRLHQFRNTPQVQGIRDRMDAIEQDMAPDDPERDMYTRPESISGSSRKAYLTNRDTSEAMGSRNSKQVNRDTTDPMNTRSSGLVNRDTPDNQVSTISRSGALTKRRGSRVFVPGKKVTLKPVQNSANEYLSNVGSLHGTLGQQSQQIQVERTENLNVEKEQKTNNLMEQIMTLTPEERDTVRKYAALKQQMEIAAADEIPVSTLQMLDKYEHDLPGYVADSLKGIGNVVKDITYDSLPGHAVRGMASGINDKYIPDNVKQYASNLWDTISNFVGSSEVNDVLDEELVEPTFGEHNYHKHLRTYATKLKLKDKEKEIIQKLTRLPLHELTEVRDYFRHLDSSRRKARDKDNMSVDIQNWLVDTKLAWDQKMNDVGLLNMFFVNMPRTGRNLNDTKLMRLDDNSYHNRHLEDFQLKIGKIADNMVKVHEKTRMGIDLFGYKNTDIQTTDTTNDKPSTVNIPEPEVKEVEVENEVENVSPSPPPVPTRSRLPEKFLDKLSPTKRERMKEYFEDLRVEKRKARIDRKYDKIHRKVRNMTAEQRETALEYAILAHKIEDDETLQSRFTQLSNKIANMGLSSMFSSVIHMAVSGKTRVAERIDFLSPTSDQDVAEYQQTLVTALNDAIPAMRKNGEVKMVQKTGSNTWTFARGVR